MVRSSIYICVCVFLFFSFLKEETSGFADTLDVGHERKGGGVRITLTLFDLNNWRGGAAI